MGSRAMGEMVDHLDSTKLVPFKKRRNGYHLPGLQKEAEEQVIDQVDPELRPEEQGFVRHFLGYADVFLNHASEQDKELSEEGPPEQPTTNVVRMPRRDDEAA